MKSGVRAALDEVDILRQHRKLLDWHIPRCGADCCPGNDLWSASIDGEAGKLLARAAGEDRVVEIELDSGE